MQEKFGDKGNDTQGKEEDKGSSAMQQKKDNIGENTTQPSPSSSVKEVMNKSNGVQKWVEGDSGANGKIPDVESTNKGIKPTPGSQASVHNSLNVGEDRVLRSEGLMNEDDPPDINERTP